MTLLDWLRRRPSVRWMVQDQARAGDPPDVQQTYLRLRPLGLSERQAWRELVGALKAEMESMRKEGRFFDREAYAQRLKALPQGTGTARSSGP